MWPKEAKWLFSSLKKQNKHKENKDMTRPK